VKRLLIAANARLRRQAQTRVSVPHWPSVLAGEWSLARQNVAQTLLSVPPRYWQECGVLPDRMWHRHSCLCLAVSAGEWSLARQNVAQTLLSVPAVLAGVRSSCQTDVAQTLLSVPCGIGRSAESCQTECGTDTLVCALRYWQECGVLARQNVAQTLLSVPASPHCMSASRLPSTHDLQSQGYSSAQLTRPARTGLLHTYSNFASDLSLSLTT